MKILIIKIGALGDVVRTSFVAQALKDKYKQQAPEIYWITDEKAKSFFVNNSYVDHVLGARDKDQVKKLKFDLVINLEEDEENAKLATNLQAKEIRGFYYKEGQVLPTPTAKEWYDMSALGEKPKNNILKKKNKKTHRQIMSEIIGVDPKRYEPFLRLNEKQRSLAQDFLRRYRLSRDQLIIGVNTGAADRWPKALSIKKTVELINTLSKKLNAKILLFGGQNEVERNKQILTLSKSPIIDTGSGNDLLEFPALVSVCNLFITSDSLGLHVALALKRKTICLLGPTSPSEIDLYGLGEKIVAQSSCTCCYTKDCKSMEKISMPQILQAVQKLLRQRVTVVITAFKEPQMGKAIEAAQNQKTRYAYEIFVLAPDKPTLDIAREYSKRDKRVKVMVDPGKGKSFALNLVFKEKDTDILILTDGDVTMSENAVEEIVNLFEDPEIGCVTGKPTPVEEKTKKYGYWANFLFDAAHRIRKQASENHDFIECSGYLFALRKRKIEKIPLDVAEDSIIPYYFWEKGYRIGYAENALVLVKNADNWKDWIKQKTRTSKAHETLDRYVNTEITRRVKSFTTEAKGAAGALAYASNMKEVLWTLELIVARLYMWVKVFVDTKWKSKHYQDAWERVESTK